MTKNVFTAIILFILLSYKGVCQEPYLGSVSTFAVFTAAGAFNNLGTSSITGDIGTNSSTVTGFPPGFVSGDIVEIGNPISSQAAIDVTNAYNDLLAVPCDSIIGTTLGSGQNLPPNVYCFGGMTTLLGELILDGQGDSTSIFIFKIDGAFSTSTFSTVTLINSASSKHIYWQVNGQFELGDYSLFKGTVIANGAISLLESSSIEGRALSIAGAISLHNNNIYFKSDPIDLSIELDAFSVEKNGENNELSWNVFSQTNNDFFTIEKRIDGDIFEIVGIVDGAGNSSFEQSYNLIDSEVKNQINYYRMKQTDFDGQYVYTSIISIDNRMKGKLKTVEMITNLLGQEVNELYDGFIIYHYSDGTNSNINYKVN